jgi:Transposase DDE domain
MVGAATKLPAAVAGRPEAAEAAGLLGAIVAQDVKLDPGTGTPRLRQAIAKDRIVSHSDPEMRHGRKAAPRRSDGHKLHVVEDQATELVLGVDIGPGNGADGDAAAPLLAQTQQDTSVTIGEAVGDMAHGYGDTAPRSSRSASRWWPRSPAHNGACFAKTDFQVDPDRPQARCPAGQTTTTTRATRDHKRRATVMLVRRRGVCRLPATSPVRERCWATHDHLSVHEARLAKAGSTSSARGPVQAAPPADHRAQDHPSQASRPGQGALDRPAQGRAAGPADRHTGQS